MTAPNFRIRACSVMDSDLLSLVANAAFLEAFADELNVADLIAHCAKNNSPAAFTKYLSTPATQAHVAEIPEGNCPVGYILTCEPELPAECMRPGDYELKRLYLLHRFQGAGIGRALMQRAFDVTRQLERQRLLLGVYSENHAALRFYERAGFRKIGERIFQVGGAMHLDYVLAHDVPTDEEAGR
jgi:ribosomal protein S18 acetylase RimI-like enzyme